jgi:YebC/PmpR family DNA-binding regulatory protein
MAGHSKWAKLKHTKGAIDAKRGNMFSKLSREIILAAKSSGDPKLNSRLRTAIDAAKAVNMPGDTIDRAIKKGTGELGGEAIVEVTYEGYAVGGVAIFVEGSTDNKNRSAADVRSVFSRNHGSLGTPGSVARLFARQGEIRLPSAAASEDAMMDAALDAGAEDVTFDGDEHVLLTPPEQLFAVGNALTAKGLKPTSQKLIFTPQTLVAVDDPRIATQVLRLCEALDDLDDVQHVYSNCDIPDAVLEQVTL